MGFNLERFKESIKLHTADLPELYSEVTDVIERSDDRPGSVALVQNAAEGQTKIAEDYIANGTELHYTAAQTGGEAYDLDSVEKAEELIWQGDVAYAIAETYLYLLNAIDINETVMTFLDASALPEAEERRRLGSTAAPLEGDDEPEVDTVRGRGTIRTRGW